MTCPDCEEPHVPGFRHCLAHLTEAERGAVLRSDNPEVRQSYLRYRKQLAAQNAAQNFAQESTPGLPRSAALICPHCGERGRITSETVRVKRGVSGGKLTGAIITGGISMLGTGLSRKETLTRRHCHACGSTWQF